MRGYGLANKHFVPGGVNRVLLLTDGDFKVGETDGANLARLAKPYADEGIHVTVRVFVEGLGATVVPVAKDVKIRVASNPDHVAAYQLIGYESRELTDAEYYDVGSLDLDAGDPAETTEGAVGFLPGERFALQVRYKLPQGGASREHSEMYAGDVLSFGAASTDTRFAAAVAAFAMQLRNSPYLRSEHGDLLVSSEEIRSWAVTSLGVAASGTREEFLALLDAAARLRAARAAAGVVPILPRP
jgi:Ca-activated chloride channel family protein